MLEVQEPDLGQVLTRYREAGLHCLELCGRLPRMALLTSSCDCLLPVGLRHICSLFEEGLLNL